MKAQSNAGVEWAAERGEKWRAYAAEMNKTLTPVDEPLIKALRLDAPYRIADIGCGGGGTTLEISRRAPAGSAVHGFDISPALVEAARRTIPADGQNGVRFEVADMGSASAPPQPYDRLTSRFGIMFFADPSAAFANLANWLAAEGRFAFAVWGTPAENPWMTTVREIVGQVVQVPSSDPSGPGLFRYADANTLLTLLDHAGFSELRSNTWRGALPIGGVLVPEEAAAFALASFSTFGELLATAGPEAFRTAHLKLTEVFSQHWKDGAVRMDAAVHIVTGTRSRD